jgi:hypothetical protein
LSSLSRADSSGRISSELGKAVEGYWKYSGTRPFSGGIAARAEPPA